MRHWHLRVSSVGRRALFPTEALRRRGVRTVVRICDVALLLFALADDHLHVVIVCDEAQLARLRRALLQALAAITGLKLVSYVVEVESRAHLLRLVSYHVTQASHHGLAIHDAIWSGSCFQDLIGARWLAPIGRRLSSALPRLRQGDLWNYAGLGGAPLSPATDDDIRIAGPHRLAAASAAAVCADPDLADRSAPVVAARKIASHLAETAGLRRIDVASALRISAQRVGQLTIEPIEPRLVRAARLQLTLENAVSRLHRAVG